MDLKSICSAAAVLLAVSACSTTSAPRIVSANDQGITYQVAPDRQSDARSAAAEYCQSKNRSAELRTVTPVGSNRTSMNFSCI